MVGLRQKNSIGQLQPAEKFYSRYYVLELLNSIPNSGINMLGEVLEKQRNKFSKVGFFYIHFFSSHMQNLMGRSYFQTTTAHHQADDFKSCLDVIKDMF